MTNIRQDLKEPFADLLLSLADDKFILGHRNSDWTGLAPILEEDIAFSSLAQDEIAHAKALYELIGGLLGRYADELAFGRGLEAYRCATIVELPDEFDWATAICRQLFCNRFDALRLARLARSTHKPRADLTGRLAAEQRIHVEHADSWVVPRDEISATGEDDVIWRYTSQDYRMARGYAASVRKKWEQVRAEKDISEYEKDDLREMF